ncbi:hypothetical protein [Actinokineospora globicatena]|uniref:hypothetical protein n=1 Tax=Actinokineospora globicatena TaxID=103729 RepID=UPI0020A352A0|nr:hypothetical protein [Actinokineospora globicatena]MCP2302688.1 hypothetical protein [Actinokineospora globicatena]GLW75625.1 hypothetical protein Aglo01_01070 [Actinokineospora globicatena]GLW82465.1 hypothetical protein Aglo02_01060 [Actinokineospora globicatena]
MSREEVAAAQGELLRSLLAGGSPPAGFDPGAIRVEAAALLGKRRRIVREIDPGTAEELGDRFAELFAEYALANPRRDGSRFREDAVAFAAWATERGHLRRARRRWWRRSG